MKDYERLLKAVRWSRKTMEPFRRKRQQTVRIMYGAHWADGSTAIAQPVNMLELTVRIWLRNLVAKAPTVRVSPKDRKWKPLAKDFELVMEQVIREIDLASALQDAAFDALTCPVGVVKVGITEEELGEQAGYLHDAGLPFCDAVDFDDLVLDMAAGRFEAMAYVGDRYVLPYEAVMDSKLFKRSRELKPTETPTTTDEFGNVNVKSFAEWLSGVARTDERDAEPMIELWDIWKPRESVVCTFVSGRDGLPVGDPVRTVEWQGPECGPYQALSFGKGKGLMKLPPIAALRDLNDIINRNYRKLDKQSGRQKTVIGYQGGAKEDAENVMNAPDGSLIQMDRPDAVKEYKYGGADPTNLAFSINLIDRFSYMAGNLDAQGGLSQSASTLGQEELIKESASQTIEDMRTTTVMFAKRVTESIAAWVWYDPVKKYMVNKPIGDSGITIPVSVDPRDREEADFLEMAFDIVPTSMMDTSNAARLRTLTTTVQQVLLPLVPAVEAGGMKIDVAGLMNTIAELTDNPEIGTIVVPSDQIAGLSPGGAAESGAEPASPSPGKPPVTRREYVRKSVPSGGTRSARDNVVAQRLLGGNVTPQQDAMVGR